MIDQLDENTLAIYEQVKENPKVPMTLRIGIAGPRFLSDKGLSQASINLTKILLDVSSKMKEFIRDSEIANKIYDLENNPLPTLRLTSALAVGADRICMSSILSEALSNDCKLEFAGILPFLLEDCETGMIEYTQSDAQNWQELNTHVEKIKAQSKSRLIELDGDISTPESRDRAHYRCAEYLVENIDLLIVVSKDKKSTSSGLHLAGTNTTIKLAREAGRPVIRIACESEDTEPNLYIHPAKRFGRNEKTDVYSADILARLLTRLVLFGSLFMLDDVPSYQSNNQPLSDKDKLDIQDLVTKGLQQHIDDKNKLKVNNGETDFNNQGVTSSPFSGFEKFIGYEEFERFKKSLINDKEVEHDLNKKKQRLKLTEDQHISENPEVTLPNNIQEAHSWFAYFLRADSLAVRFASIHRSTYLSIYFFASSALVIAATGLTFQTHKPLVGVLIVLELLALCSIYFLYVKDHHNHHKWLQNRCLAEAIRPNVFLSQLGRCFSFLNIRSSDEFMYREIMGHSQSGAQWVCIQAEVINRHIGFGHCRYTPEYLAQSVAFLNSSWVSGQISYHMTNAIKMRHLGKRFSTWTHRLFYLTCAAVIIKAVMFIAKAEGVINLDEQISLYLAYAVVSLLTAALPILGTAMFAIRNHSEFDISAQRSLTMLAFFNSLTNSITSKERENSECLDSELKRLTDVSVQEVSDWLEIYEVKESEPG